jgi:hypothetical protein
MVRSVAQTVHIRSAVICIEIKFGEKWGYIYLNCNFHKAWAHPGYRDDTSPYVASPYDTSPSVISR